MGSRSYGGEHGESLRGRRPCRQRHRVSPTKGSCFSLLELSAATCCGAAEVMIDLSVSSSGFCFHRDADRSWRVILRLAFRKTRESKHSCFGTHAYGTEWRVDRSVEYCCFGTGFNYRTVHPFWDKRPRAKRRLHYLYPEPYKPYPCSPVLPEPNNQKPLSSHCTTFNSQNSHALA